jgi:hypothetical protein
VQRLIAGWIACVTALTFGRTLHAQNNVAFWTTGGVAAPVPGAGPLGTGELTLSTVANTAPASVRGGILNARWSLGNGVIGRHVSLSPWFAELHFVPPHGAGFLEHRFRFDVTANAPVGPLTLTTRLMVERWWLQSTALTTVRPLVRVDGPVVRVTRTGGLRIRPFVSNEPVRNVTNGSWPLTIREVGADLLTRYVVAEPYFGQFVPYRARTRNIAGLLLIVHPFATRHRG